jgi:hypothetical protein
VNPPPTTDTQPYPIAFLGGAALWLLTSLISGHAEAWDAPMYWTVTLSAGDPARGCAGVPGAAAGLALGAGGDAGAGPGNDADLRRLDEPAAARARAVRDPGPAGDRGGDVRGEDADADRVAAAFDAISPGGKATHAS